MQSHQLQTLTTFVWLNIFTPYFGKSLRYRYILSSRSLLLFCAVEKNLFFYEHRLLGQYAISLQWQLLVVVVGYQYSSLLTTKYQIYFYLLSFTTSTRLLSIISNSTTHNNMHTSQYIMVSLPAYSAGVDIIFIIYLNLNTILIADSNSKLTMNYEL